LPERGPHSSLRSVNAERFLQRIIAVVIEVLDLVAVEALIPNLHPGAEGPDTKHLVNIASLPPDAEIGPEWNAFLASFERPASQKRIEALMKRGFHKAGDVENRLGYYVGQLGS
jgi:hypothetical protein